MKYIIAFGKFWYHFIVGDDYKIALGVVIGLVVTALAVHANPWWLLPVVAFLTLIISVIAPISARRHKAKN